VYILPVFLYGAETWSITKAIERRINALDQWCLRHILNITWSEHVTNSEIRRRTGQPLLSEHARRLKLFGHVAWADKSQDHSCALRACIWHSPKNWKWCLGRPVLSSETPGWERWRQTCVRSTSVLHQGSRRHRTELPGTHSRERLHHRQAPNDDDVIVGLLVVTVWLEHCTSCSSSCHNHLHHS